MAMDSGKCTLGSRSHLTFLWTQCVTHTMSRDLKHHRGPAVIIVMHEVQGTEYITVLHPAYGVLRCVKTHTVVISHVPDLNQ